MSLGYNGKLDEVLNHKKLFFHYPQLATLPLFFAYNEASTFYFSDSGEGNGFINIQGNKENHYNFELLVEEKNKKKRLEIEAKLVEKYNPIFNTYKT
jgi:hypothetical protein